MSYRSGVRKSAVVGSMTAIVAWVLVSVLVPVLLTGCSSKEPGRYYNSSKGFSLKFPEGWAVKENFMGAAVIANSPLENENDKFSENMNVVVIDLQQDMTAEEYANVSAPFMKKMLANYQQIDNGTGTIDHRPIRWITSTYRMNDFNIKAISYMMTKGRRAYLVTCTATPETFESYRLIFQSSMLTFRLE